ncbi:MAG: triose-phosphate isomerase [Lentisphaerae bacterium GWF2_44_16]|nr:MAG: triose-phosphate isomerase [Lentisphaerae bacterium GWF2_44_16]
MARKVIIAGNWKMNKSGSEGKALVEDLKGRVAGYNDVDIVVCPPFTTLAAVVKAAEGSNIKVGAQNVHWADNGAFTGEISAGMLKEAGVEYAIIGHSERRQYFGETDETVNKRLKAALAAGLKPIVCIGELLDEREGGKTEAVLAKQIKAGFAGLTSADMNKIVIAYEPVWAIGTGKTATPEMAEETHAYIRKAIAGLFDGTTAEAVRIQYGGSMKADNAAELVKQPDIDGGLIGGASLKADSFADLIKNASSK